MYKRVVMYPIIWEQEEHSRKVHEGKYLSDWYSVNNCIVSAYRVVIAATNIVTRRTNKA